MAGGSGVAGEPLTLEVYPFPDTLTTFRTFFRHTFIRKDTSSSCTPDYFVEKRLEKILFICTSGVAAKPDKHKTNNQTPWR